MAEPIPYSEYDQADVRALLDALPLSAEGRRIGAGMYVSFIVRMESHTRTHSIVCSRVVGTTPDRVFFELGFSKLNSIGDGIPGNRCYIDPDLCRTQFASQQVDRLDETA